MENVKLVLGVIYYLTASVGLAFLVNWWLDYGSVIEIGPGWPNKTQVAPGESIVFTLPIKKLRDCPGQSTRYITGQCGTIELSHVETTLRKGFYANLVIPAKIPDNVALGTCEFRIAVRYICNPFDWITTRRHYYSDPIDFNVVKEGTN